MNIIRFAITILVCFVELGTFKQFFDHFFLRKKKKSRFQALFAGTVLLSSFAVINYYQEAILNSIFGLAIAYGFVSFFYIGSKKQKTIFTIIITLVHVVSEVATIYLVSAIWKQPYMVLKNSPLQMLFMFMLSKSMAWFVVRTILYLFPAKHYALPCKKSLSFIFYPLAAMINIAILQYLQFSNAFDSKILLVLAGMSMVVLCSGISVIIAYDSAMEKQELENQLLVNQQRQSSIEILMKASDLFDEETRKMIHDCKNQILNIQYAYQRGETKADEYVAALVGRFDNILKCKPVNLNNKAIEGILFRFSNQCQRNHIHFDILVEPCDLSFLDILDASSILDNALENAFFAVENQILDNERIIALSIFHRSLFTIIEVKNTKSNNIIIKDGEIISEKADAKLHGHGVKSIRETARKYGGDASFEYDDTSLTVTIYLNGLSN